MSHVNNGEEEGVRVKVEVRAVRRVDLSWKLIRLQRKSIRPILLGW